MLQYRVILRKKVACFHPGLMKRAAAVTGTFLIQKGVIQKKPLIQKPKVLVKSPGTALTHPSTDPPQH